MRISLATGIPELDNAIELKIKKAEFAGSALYKEAVEEVVRENQPNILILSELLEGTLSSQELILFLRSSFPELRIIYIMKDDNPEMKAFLYHWLVFDIFSGTFTVAQLEKSIFEPKAFKDVSHELEELRGFQNSLQAPPKSAEGLNQFEEGPHVRFKDPGAGTDELYHSKAAFWSVLDQSGKTFSIVNTAIALSTRQELKILLLDFNTENPNIHQQFGFLDPDRNLGALIEDMENGEELTKQSFERYLINHPTYHNVYILPGMILKMKARKPDFIYSVYENIIDIAEQSNFSTILIDVNSGLRDELTLNILKNVNRILLHITETPGSLYAVRRCFDKQVGPFVSNLIDFKKVAPIITRSQENMRMNFKEAVESTLSLPVTAFIQERMDIIDSLYKGKPLLTNKTGAQDLYDYFLLIANLVHRNIFKAPIKPKKIQLKSPQPSPISPSQPEKGLVPKPTQPKQQVHPIQKDPIKKNPLAPTHGEKAGFGLRFIAHSIDSLLIGFLPIASSLIFSSFLDPVTNFAVSTSIFFPTTLLYYTKMESSRFQGTIGKKMLGLAVTDEEGNQISFVASIKRFLAKSVMFLIPPIFLTVHTNSDNQGLHDKFAKTFVLKK